MLNQQQLQPLDFNLGHPLQAHLVVVSSWELQKLLQLPPQDFSLVGHLYPPPLLLVVG